MICIVLFLFGICNYTLSYFVVKTFNPWISVYSSSSLYFSLASFSLLKLPPTAQRFVCLANCRLQIVRPSEFLKELATCQECPSLKARSPGTTNSTSMMVRAGKEVIENGWMYPTGVTLSVNDTSYKRSAHRPGYHAGNHLVPLKTLFMKKQFWV